MPAETPRQRRARAAAALKAEQERAARRRRLLTVIAPLAVVVVIIAALVVAKVAQGGKTVKGTQATTAATGVIADVTTVPAATFNTVGPGAIKAAPVALTGGALTADGKPRVLYVGAEYCPFCAAERWAVVAALSRFGTWANLGQTASSSVDVYPSTPTFTFHGATYTSSVLSFTGVETETNDLVNGAYTPLDSLSAADTAIVKKYDAPPYVASASKGAIPFIDIGGKYLISGASYDPALLQGKTATQIAAALADPTSPVSQAIVGTANVITAALCSITANQPDAVCASAGVTAAAAKLPASTSG